MAVAKENLDFAKLQLSYARAFERAALRVIEHEPPRQRSLHAPTLHLIAHGYELAMKSLLSLKSVSEKQQRQIGHDLRMLWEREELVEFRNWAEKAAIDCCDEARASGEYEDHFPNEPDKEFITQLHMLRAGFRSS